MKQLFGTAAFFTDIHFGKSSDSEVHNQDCIRFMEWFRQGVREAECDTVFFLGDWFDNQVKIRKDTNHYSNQALHMLNDLGMPVYMLVGNHDMYYKNSRDKHALVHVDQFDNITLIEDLITIGGVSMAPYLVTDEFVLVPPEEGVKYVLGHFALPGFLTNETYEWPDKGVGLHGDHFETPDYVFSGHFHKRQMKRNEHGVPVAYIGNCFPHNFNDVNDRERGCMILEWGGEPNYVTWEQAPNYNRIKLSVLEERLDMFNEWSTIECFDDVGLDQDDALRLKEDMQSVVRDFKMKLTEGEIDGSQEVDMSGVDLKSPEDMVLGYIDKIDTEDSEWDKELLKQIFVDAVVE